jgi:citrate synthase
VSGVPPSRACSPGSILGRTTIRRRTGQTALRRARPPRKGTAISTQQATATAQAGEASADTLTITDNRTGKSYELPITDGTIRATDLRQIKVTDDEFGMMTYDPAFMNTASCRSAITFIDGDLGILRYRGYPIDQLAEKSTFLEVSYLLVHGELPTQSQLDGWVAEVTAEIPVDDSVAGVLKGFARDAHPMAMLAVPRGHSNR